MKRLTILLSVAALTVAGTTLTSCVKNEESQSVTDIRTAKAAQLNAMATLAKSQADAALIMANADKVLKEAEAALANAQAAVQQAIADKDQVAIETAKLALEQAKATHQLEIDAAIAAAEGNKLTALMNLKTLKDAAAASSITNVALQNLIAAYETELGDWNSLQADLIAAKVALSKAELDLVDVTTAKQNVINEEKVKIASAESMITFLKTIDVTNKAKLETQLDAVTGKLKVATENASAASAQNTYDKTFVAPAVSAYTDADYYKAVAVVADAAVVTMKSVVVKALENLVTLPDGTSVKVVANPVAANYNTVDIKDATALTALITSGGSDAIKAAAKLLSDAAAKTVNDKAYAAVLAAENVQMKSALLAAETSAIAGIYTSQKASITTLLASIADVPTLVAAEEAKITASKTKIADVSSIETQEQLIAFGKSEVASLENGIIASEKQLDVFFNAIEAEIKK